MLFMSCSNAMACAAAQKELQVYLSTDTLLMGVCSSCCDMLHVLAGAIGSHHDGALLTALSSHSLLHTEEQC